AVPRGLPPTARRPVVGSALPRGPRPRPARQPGVGRPPARSAGRPAVVGPLPCGGGPARAGVRRPGGARRGPDRPGAARGRHGPLPPGEGGSGHLGRTVSWNDLALTVALTYNHVVLVYFLLINTQYLVLMVVGFLETRRALHEMQWRDLRRLMRSPLT